MLEHSLCFVRSDSEEHVMISYQWDMQETMLRVKTELEIRGFSVWMDVEQMQGSILETMARAVEKSSLLLLAVSRKYQNSPNCRSGVLKYGASYVCYC